MESNIIVLAVIIAFVKDAGLKREYPAGRQQGTRKKWHVTSADSKLATLLKL